MRGESSSNVFGSHRSPRRRVSRRVAPVPPLPLAAALAAPAEEVAPMKRSRSYDDGDLATLKLLVSDEVISNYAASARVPRSEEDKAKCMAAGRPDWSYQFDRSQLDLAQLSSGVWIRERERRINRETGRRALTLDDAEVARVVDPRDPEHHLDLVDKRLKARTFLLCPCCRDPLVLPVFRRCGHACCSYCTTNSALMEEECVACSKDFDLYEKLSDTDRLVNCGYGKPPSVTLAITVFESGISPGWAFNWNLGTWFFYDGKPLAESIPGAMKAWAAAVEFEATDGAVLSAASSAPFAAAAAVMLFGGGTFLAAFADKSGDQDWTGTLLMIAIGKLFGTVSLCQIFKAPTLVSPWTEGARYAVVAPMLYTAAFVFMFALVSQGADMAVVMPATQLSVLLPAALGVMAYGEKVTSALVGGIVTMLFGATLLSLPPGGAAAMETHYSNHTSFGTSIGYDADGHEQKIATGAFLLLLLGAVLGMGLGQVCYIHAAKRCENWKVAMGSTVVGLALTLVFAVGLRLSLCTFNPDCSAFSVRSGMVTLGAHLVLAGGMAAYTLLMNMGDAALYSAIMTLNLMVPVALGIAVLGESLNATQYGGVVLCCVAALMLGGCGGGK